VTDLDILLTAERIRAICPRARPDILEAVLTEPSAVFAAAGITGQAGLAHLLAQMATETGGLGRLDENLNYTTAARLRSIFPSRFKTLEEAKPFLKSPEKLANFVYKGKNGNTAADDGWRFRGSGLIQITGRGNFAAVGKLVGLDLVGDPEMARQPDSALRVALGYWTARKISAVIRDGGEGEVEAVTKLVNPAMVGLKERKAFFRKAMIALAPPKTFALTEGLAAAVQPFGAAFAAAPAVELSGPQWVARFPTSRAVEDLAQPFSLHVAEFLEALRAAGATVMVSATFRPKERAYLMHWAWMIAKEGFDPTTAPPMPGVAIEWAHPSLAKSRAAALQMVQAYGMVQVAALNSRHTDSLAIDMTLAWNGVLSIRARDGTRRDIATQPRNGGNKELVAVGKDYGVIKLTSDPPHWSSDGR
jgi:predicted chitinase